MSEDKRSLLEIILADPNRSRWLFVGIFALVATLMIVATLVIFWFPIAIVAFIIESWISSKGWYGHITISNRIKRALMGPFYPIFLIYRKVFWQFF